MCAKTDNPSVIGIDKTYNLGHFYVSAVTYKHKGVLGKKSKESPILFGPILIHGGQSREVYERFFYEIRTKLRLDDCANLIFGSDDEKAITSAIRGCFPNSTLLMCIRHLKQNVDFYLINKIGCNKRLRRKIDEMIFGSKGIIHSTDLDSFDYKWREFTKFIEEMPDFLEYCNQRLYNHLKFGVVLPHLEKSIQPGWTNNNAESANHILKSKCNWKQLNLVQILKCLLNLFKQQDSNLMRVLYGHGEYLLAEDWSQYKLSIRDWSSMPEKQQCRKKHEFLTHRRRKFKHCAIASNTSLRVSFSTHAGKKVRQRTRRKPNKTISY